jgi:ABC-2 type transport system permease protein
MMRRYLKTAAMAATGQLGEGPLFLIDYLLRFLRVAVLLALWRVILAGRGPVSGMTLPAVLTYTLVAEVFAEQLACRAGLEDVLWDGSVVTRFLRPLSMVGQFAAEMAGRWAFSFAAFSLPLLLAAGAMGVDPRPAGPAAALLFPVSLGLAVAVGLALDFLFAALMVYLEISIWLLNQLRAAAGVLLSGALIPLALLPWGLGDLFGWLPFAAMASAPLRIYTGTGPAAWLLASQLAWALLLWPLAQLLWRASRERMVSHGG